MRKISAVLSLILLLFLLTLSVSAFDGNDYDYGGGDYDWGGGNDWGGGGYTSGGSGGFDDLFSSIISVPVIIAIIIFIIISKASNKNKQQNMQPSPGRTIPQGATHIILPDRTQQIEKIIKEHDPNFSASDFVTYAKQLYFDVQQAWCARDLSKVRPLLHKNLYETTEKQVQMKIQQGIVYHYESMVVNTAYLTSYLSDKEYEYLTVYLSARMIDYQVDEKTGNIVRGDKTTRWELRYKMKFMRSLSVKTNSHDENLTAYNCPNCGAPLIVSSSGKCEYCDSVVTTGLYNWVLSDFMTIRNDTVDEGIRTDQQ